MLVFPSVFCKRLPVVKITPKLVPQDHRYDRYSMGPPGLIRDTIANHHAPGEVTTAFWWTHPPKSLRLMDVHSQTIFKEWLYHIVQINMDVQITISYCSSSLSEHLIVIWLMVSSNPSEKWCCVSERQLRDDKIHSQVFLEFHLCSKAPSSNGVIIP